MIAGGEAYKNFSQTEGAKEGNTYNQEQLSRGELRDDIFVGLSA